MNLQLSPEHLLRALVTDADEAIVCFWLDGSVVVWNAAAERLYGYSAKEVLGKRVSLTLPLYEIPAMDALLRHPEFPPGNVSETVERIGKQGIRLSLRIQRSVIRNDAGAPIAIMEKATNCCGGLTEIAAEAHLRLLMEQMPVVFWTADLRLRITSHWGSGFRGLRAFRGNPPGQTIHEYLGCPRDQETPVKQHLDALSGVASRFEYRRRKRVFDMSIEPMRNTSGAVIGCIGVALDITDRKKTEEEIRFQATHDGLTGLANYREFVSHLEDEVRRSSRSGRAFGLLLLDLGRLETHQ
jgi:PAS domain S-box-containing protein